MSGIKETVDVLHNKIDECDDLIVEISQLRYRLEAILSMLERNPDPKKPIPQRCRKSKDKSVA
jgi:hypothetical protein